MKLRYAINNDNQLIVKSPKAKKAIVVKGRLKIDKGNHLTYLISESPKWRKSYGLPAKIIFKGKWRLNLNHDLELVLTKSRSQLQGDTLTIKAEIISFESQAIIFEVKSFDQNGLLHIQILKLGVSWCVNESNRINFSVKKRFPDMVTLEGAWQLNQDQQVVYTYEKTELKTKTKAQQELAFQGSWQINQANRLVYVLRGNADSRFEFRGQFESTDIYPEEGCLKYRLGIGLRKTKAEKLILLYGDWKIDRNLDLNFEIGHAGNHISRISFSVNISFGRSEVIFSLKDNLGEPLNINVIFNCTFLKKSDSLIYFRLRACAQEAGIELGARIPF